MCLKKSPVKKRSLSKYSQVNNEEEEEDNDEPAHSGVEVDDTEEHAKATERVDPVQPVPLPKLILIVIIYRASLGVHTDVLIGWLLRVPQIGGRVRDLW